MPYSELIDKEAVFHFFVAVADPDNGVNATGERSRSRSNPLERDGEHQNRAQHGLCVDIMVGFALGEFLRCALSLIAHTTTFVLLTKN
jgi:hypothetical protein